MRLIVSYNLFLNLSHSHITNFVIEDVSTKTGSTETENIKLKLKEFSLKKELKSLENKIVPPVDQFRVDINNFKAELVDHQQMIRRFDEVICQKASKTSIQEVCSTFTPRSNTSCTMILCPNPASPICQNHLRRRWHRR